MKLLVKLFFVIVFFGLGIWAWYCYFEATESLAIKPTKAIVSELNEEQLKFDLFSGELVQTKMYYTFNNATLLNDTILNGVSIAEVPINSPIKVLEMLYKAESINGYSYNWFKVKYKNHIGYMVSNDIAFSRLLLPNDSSVASVALINIDSYKDGLNMRVKLINDSLEISSFVFKSFASDEGYDIVAKLVDNKGLTGVKKFVEIEMSMGACGIYTGSYFLFWDGEQLYDGIAEAGLGDPEGGDYEDLVFPIESGMKDTVISKSVSFEYSGANNTRVTTDSTNHIYIWREKKGLEKL